MATSPDYVRLASSATRPLTDAIFDALREAVLVVDTRARHLPIVLANSAARRCVLGNPDAGSLIDCSLYSLLASPTDPTVEVALNSLSVETPSISRTLTWRFPHGKVTISTELKLVASAPLQQTVMFTFTEPSSFASFPEPAVLSAIEQLPLDLLILDKELTITYANAGAARTAGTTPRQMLGYSALALAPTSAVPREAFIGALEGIHFRDEAIEVKTPGAPTRWFEVDVQPLEDETGIVGAAVLSLEVAESQVNESTIDGSERRLMALTEHARDIISIAGSDGKWQYVSGGITNALGYSAEERRSNEIFEFIHPDDLEDLRSKYSELISGKASSFTHQYRVRHRDGSYRWLESSWVSDLENPLVNGVVVNGRDVTDRKEAEYTLAQREEVFRLAADAVSGIIFEWDLCEGVVHRSRGVQDVLGMDPRELQAEGAWSARIHPQDAAAYEAKVASALNSARGWTATYRIRDAHGHYRSLLERGLIQRGTEGGPIRAIGCAVDVSEIKRLTNLLDETQGTAKMGGWEYNYATRELEWTDQMYSIYETQREEFAVTWHSMMAQCPPDSKQRLNDAIKAAEATDGRLDVEIEILTLKNQRLWVHVIGQMEKLDGRAFRALGSVQNIQVQKLAQIALENSTDWLKLSMNMAHMHAWRWNRATDTLEFAMDDLAENLPRAFPGMKKLLSRVHPQDRLAVRRAIDQSFEQHREVHQEFRLKSHNGQYRAYAAVARPLFDAANQPSGLVGVTQDITERHESEARLRRSEELLRITTDNTADTLILLDADLRIRFINRDEQGMSIDQIVGQDISVLLPEAERDAAIAKLRGVLVSAEPVTYEFECKSAAATEYFESRAVLVREDGTGISITVRNITEQRRLQQEILDVANRERQAIGRDLHDGLGQELTGVALMLRGLATRFQKQCPDSIGQVNEIVTLVNQSIDTARALARGLLPVNKDGEGLSSALRALTDRSRDLYGFDAYFQAEVSQDLTLNETTASHLYRIAQEALTNTARHARATAVAIYLTVTKNRFSLRITDDGTGIGDAARSASGMGLKIMKYRAAMIGAKIEFVPNDPHGTVISVTGERSTATNSTESVQAL
ncbi:MAG: two-component system, NarL family, sensor histidine kinase UhpB [Gammaproteobacteria bacterium]|nr:two-component system, NarL family, sensor histidine kinase UhpB [Gammaproteobacteria bacterium]